MSSIATAQVDERPEGSQGRVELLSGDSMMTKKIVPNSSRNVLSSIDISRRTGEVIDEVVLAIPDITNAVMADNMDFKDQIKAAKLDV